MVKTWRKGLKWQDKATWYALQPISSNPLHNVKAHIARCELFSIISICFNHINVQTCSNHEKNDMSCLYIYTHTGSAHAWATWGTSPSVTMPQTAPHQLHTTKKAATQSESAIAYSVKQKRITQWDISYINLKPNRRGWSLNSTSWAGLNLSECRSKQYQNFPSFLHKSLDASANKACGDEFCLEPHTQLFSLFTQQKSWRTWESTFNIF